MSYPIQPRLKDAWDRAIAFIAYNDDDAGPDALGLYTVRSYTTVVLVSETFQVHVEKVARAVIKLRRAREKKDQGKD